MGVTGASMQIAAAACKAVQISIKPLFAIYITCRAALVER